MTPVQWLDTEPGAIPKHKTIADQKVDDRARRDGDSVCQEIVDVSDSDQQLHQQHIPGDREQARSQGELAEAGEAGAGAGLPR